MNRRIRRLLQMHEHFAETLMGWPTFLLLDRDETAARFEIVPQSV